MISSTSIEKMESTPLNRTSDSIISLSFDGNDILKPHIFACYNNEVNSSLYLHNKLVILSSAQDCDIKTETIRDFTTKIINELIDDLNDSLEKYLPKSVFFDYINRPTTDLFTYIRYIEYSDLLYTEKPFVSAKGFVMYATDENISPGGGGSIGGVVEHNLLFNRDHANQHPISSITDLTETLSSKASTAHTHNYLSAITKSMVEQVLTGDISSHSHNIYALLNGSPTEDFSVKTLTAFDISYFHNGIVMFGADGGTGSGGSMDIVELERYLTTNPESWKLALSYLPSWVGVSKPAYNWAEIVGKPNVVMEGDYRLTNDRKAAGGRAEFVFRNDTILYGRGDLQFAQAAAGGIGTGLNGAYISSPTSDWHSHLILNHGNTDGYYQQLSCAFFSDDLYFRRLIRGVLTNWRRIALSGEPQPASDVWNWAKQPTKPSYSFSEITATADVVKYLGIIPEGSANTQPWNRGGWHEPAGGASIGYYNLFSGGSASSILLKHYYSSNEIFFKKSIDEARWLSDWNFFWTSANLNRPITTDDSRGINNRIGATNQIWFDYNWAGIGAVGSVLTFSGLGGNYSVELIGSYISNRLFFRTRNGDNLNYNAACEIYHNYSHNIIAQNYIHGDLGLCTGYGSLPNIGDGYPTLRTSGSALYFSASNMYTLGLNNEDGATTFHSGVNNRFKFINTVTTTGSVVMFSA